LRGSPPVVRLWCKRTQRTLQHGGESWRRLGLSHHRHDGVDRDRQVKATRVTIFIALPPEIPVSLLRILADRQLTDW
jgi:hypothetical protein